MLLMGDEVRRTQRGNNNAYCQNNELAWFDWSGLEQHAGLLRFVRGLIHFTQSREVFREECFWTTPDRRREAHITWHGPCLGQLDWRIESHSLAFTLNRPESGDHLHIVLNAHWQPVTCELPPLPFDEHWCRIVDTAQPSPDDFCDPGAMSPIHGIRYQVEARSSVILLAARAD
jgi:glycogen operon protein